MFSGPTSFAWASRPARCSRRIKDHRQAVFRPCRVVYASWTAGSTEHRHPRKGPDERRAIFRPGLRLDAGHMAALSPLNMARTNKRQMACVLLRCVLRAVPGRPHCPSATGTRGECDEEQ